jgi:hypothetical protein
MNTAASRIEVRPDNPLTPGPTLHGHTALEVRASHKDILVATRFLADEMPAKRRVLAKGLDPRGNYVIGSRRAPMRQPHASSWAAQSCHWYRDGARASWST